jgi:hypothetical protein
VNFNIYVTRLHTAHPPGWAFLEQLALAAIDVGRIDVADVCPYILSLLGSAGLLGRSGVCNPFQTSSQVLLV